MIRRPCPLCGSTDDSHVFAEANYDLEKLDGFAFASRKTPEYMHYRLLKCPTCDMLYSSPIPENNELEKAYAEADFDSSEEAACAARTYGAFLPGIKKKLASLEGALDIGTGDGAFLEELLADGFTGVVGIEPSKAPVAAAKDKIRPLIKETPFKADDFEDESLSLITCFQTLEHINDPRKLCESAYRMLKKGGAVFFVTHNHRSLSARVLSLKSPIFDIEHLQLFSKKSLYYLLDECGFADIEIKSVYNRYPLHYWIKLLPLPLRTKQIFLSLLKKSRIGLLPLYMPAGNIAVIGYKKTD